MYIHRKGGEGGGCLDVEQGGGEGGVDALRVGIWVGGGTYRGWEPSSLSIH